MNVNIGLNSLSNSTRGLNTIPNGFSDPVSALQGKYNLSRPVAQEIFNNPRTRNALLGSPNLNAANNTTNNVNYQSLTVPGTFEALHRETKSMLPQFSIMSLFDKTTVESKTTSIQKNLNNIHESEADTKGKGGRKYSKNSGKKGFWSFFSNSNGNNNQTKQEASESNFFINSIEA